MVTTLETIKEDLALHLEWVLSSGAKGRRLDAAGADLRWANLSYANLRWANLRYANLRWANLSYANLREANLREADLRKADLNCADLNCANLYGADLTGADLRWAEGNGREVVSIQIEKYHIVYTSQILCIGDERHLIDEWWAFTDEEIDAMGSISLEWWQASKDSLRTRIETNPAVGNG